MAGAEGPLGVVEALELMATAVQKGLFAEAAAVGNRATVPLGIASSSLACSAELSRGTQSTVHSATYHQQPVAVKKARIGTSSDLAYFRKEIRIMAQLQHRNVMGLLAAKLLPPDYLLVMPLAAKNLATQLHERGWRPDWPTALRLALQLAQGLSHVHEAGIIHRDIKPANVLLTAEDEPILTDFGIAEYAAELEAEAADRNNLVGRGKPSGGFHKRHMVGTLEYMAPEVLQKQPTSYFSDVYAWAVTVNEVATGVVPFSDCTVDNPAAHTVLEMGYGRQELAAAITPGVFATAGLRGSDRMEDRHVIASPLGSSTEGHLLAVFDGHRGAEAAEYAAGSVLQHLTRHWCAPTPAAALSRTCIDVDAFFREQQEEEWRQRVQRMGPAAASERRWPGCTALAALLWQNQLHIANAGDCRAVLCRAGKAVALSRDQTADRQDERERVLAAGGKVEWRVDSWRVGAVGLQVTRSLGDADLKADGLTAEPEVASYELTADDEFLIIASDGLWDKLRNDEAVGLVHDTVKMPAMCGQRLATEALTRGSGDNITVLVAFLKPVATLEEIYSRGRQKHKVTPTLYGSRAALLEAHSKGASADELRETY
ncbi:hypothetical protein WJX72_002777 [[Myrmecia] bisecta]|uniref:Uncharacterized protein n=1 Tax=[Myrmecia] bisecta TaxID=41462 RepID=A0AAW1R6I6_9CHLO